MDWADDVAYAVYDMEDFYRAGLIPLDRLIENNDPQSVKRKGKNTLESFLESVSRRWKEKGLKETDLADYRIQFRNLLRIFGSLDALRDSYSGTRAQRIDASKIRRGVANGYYALTTKYKVRIFGPELEVVGFPYLGSDGDAMLCGHAALWSICRYLSDRYTRYTELLPYDIISLTHKEYGRVLPDRGTDPRDYSPILSNIGTHPVVVPSNENRARRGVLDPAFHDLCAYIESGVPVLASFEGHAAALIGHTLDYQRPICLGENEWLIDHSWFFDSLIECDGNLFPYARLTYDPHSNNGRPQNGQARRYFIDDITAAVCPLPERVYLTAAMARNMALSVVQPLRGEIERYGQVPFVTRLFFTSSSAFKQHKLEAMRAQAGMESFPTFIAQLHLPHFIWIMEVASCHSYSNHQCCAEVVIDASAGPFDDGVIYARIGRNVQYAGGQREFATCPEKLPIFTRNFGRTAPYPTKV